MKNLGDSRSPRRKGDKNKNTRVDNENPLDIGKRLDGVISDEDRRGNRKKILRQILE